MADCKTCDFCGKVICPTKCHKVTINYDPFMYSHHSSNENYAQFDFCEECIGIPVKKYKDEESKAKECKKSLVDKIKSMF